MLQLKIVSHRQEHDLPYPTDRSIPPHRHRQSMERKFKTVGRGGGADRKNRRPFGAGAAPAGAPRRKAESGPARPGQAAQDGGGERSEERRVGKEWSSRWS